MVLLNYMVGKPVVQRRSHPPEPPATNYRQCAEWSDVAMLALLHVYTSAIVDNGTQH